MRALYLLRGAPGAGKSLWIRENGYEPLAVCPDSIRLALAGVEFDADGTPAISQRNDKEVWSRIEELVKVRMQKGLTTILDSTMADLHNATRFRNLAEHYRYRVYIVDFTTVDIHICEERNLKRTEYQRVPDYVIGRMYAKFKRMDVPASIGVLTPDEAKQQLDALTPIAMDDYAAINYIGDIHGCYSALIDLMKKLGGSGESDYLNEDELYVFLGDYLDRGIENSQTLDYLMRIASKKNVKLLEGNHEKHLSSWANNEKPSGSDFPNTRIQLEKAGMDIRKVRQFIRRLGQLSFYEYHGKKIFACHGGISRIPKPFAYVSTKDLINGFGAYQDVETMQEAWEEFSQKSGTFLVHGHRSGVDEKMHPLDRVYCLEGGVEYGGDLRCVRFEGDEVSTFEITNGIFRAAPERPKSYEVDEHDIAGVVAALRANDCIIEKPSGNISSFNFSNKAFYKGIWNAQTIRARGLFIDTQANKVKARSYNKFFNLEERPETSLSELKRNMKFPVDIYLKENGYLGICASDGNDGLFIASKTSTTGEHAQRFRSRLKFRLGKNNPEFAKYLSDNDLSAVFEVIEPEDDPHIVEYSEPRLVLLALVRNSIRFEQLPYLEMVNVANRFNLEPKKLLATVTDFKEFSKWVNDIEDEEWVLNGQPIEGFVAEDSAGFMVKVKGGWYRKWKSIRGMLKDIARRGRSSKTETLARFHSDTDSIYAAARKYNALCPKDKETRKGLGAPSKATNVIAFRNWYENEYIGEINGQKTIHQNEDT